MPNHQAKHRIDTQSAEQQILEAERKLTAAQLAHDVYGLDVLLHDDLLFVGRGGAVFTKQMDLDMHRAKTMAIEKLDSTIERLNIIGDNAVTVVRSEVQGAVGELPVNGTIRYIRVWKFVDGQWKVIGGSITQL